VSTGTCSASVDDVSDVSATLGGADAWTRQTGDLPGESNAPHASDRGDGRASPPRPGSQSRGNGNHPEVGPWANPSEEAGHG
jgi:hypothetical protein